MKKDIRIGDIIMNCYSSSFLERPYIVQIKGEHKVKLLTTGLHQIEPIQKANLWTTLTDKLLGNYYDIPKGMKFKIMRLFKSGDVDIIKYASDLLNSYKNLKLKNGNNRICG